MFRQPFLPRLTALVALSLAACTLSAQTATWIASGAAAATASWSNAANWDTGAVPNSASAIAVINQTSPSDAAHPVSGGAMPVITGDLSLGELRFDLSSATQDQSTQVLIGSPATGGPSGALQLFGAGITDTLTRGNATQLSVESHSSVEFKNQSQYNTSLLLSVQPDASVTFSDQSAAHRGPIIASADSTVTFAGSSRLDGAYIGSDGPVTFKDQSSAPSGFINAKAGSVGFYDHSSAGHASIQSRQVTFTDYSTASTAIISNVEDLEFKGHATAGDSQAYYGNVIRFHDQSTAGTMSLFLTKRVEVLDQASLEYAKDLRPLVLDLSGASTTGGASSRIAATGTPADAVMADNARQVTVRNLHEFNPAGAVYLGSNTLVLTTSGTIDGGEYGGQAVIRGKITDVGGAYRSASNQDYMGGGIVIAVRSTPIPGQPGWFDRDLVTISNPDNNYSGPTTIQSGALLLDGGAISATTVDVNALLFGSGAIHGGLNNNGTVNLDYGDNDHLDSPFVLHVAGDYVQGITGNLQIRVDPQNTDTLQVAGQATLNGGILHLFNSKTPGAKTTYTLITAADLTGTFAGVNLPPLGADGHQHYHLSYASDGVTLVYDPSAPMMVMSLMAFALPVAPRQIVQTPMGQRDGSEVRQLFGLDPNASLETTVQAVVAHNPASYANLTADAFMAGASLQDALDRQLGLPASAGTRWFAAAHYRSGDYDAINGLPASSTRSTDMLVGGLWTRGRAEYGAFLDYANAGRDLDAQGTTADSHTVTPGLLSRLSFGRTFLRAHAALAFQHYDLSRPIVYPGASINATASPRARRLDLGIQAGRALPFGKWTLTPLAGLLYSRWSADGFKEANVSAGAAVIASWRQPSLRSRAGFDLARATGRYTVHLRATWWHEFESAADLAARYDGATAGFTLPGRPLDDNLLGAQIALAARLSPHTVFTVGYGTLQGSHSRVTGDLSAGFQWTF